MSTKAVDFVVRITISDPWDVGVATNWERISAPVVKFSHEADKCVALIQLMRPIFYNEATYNFLVASALRSNTRKLDELEVGEETLAHFIGISDEQAALETWWDIGSWRGGLAFKGDLKRVGVSDLC